MSHGIGRRVAFDAELALAGVCSMQSKLDELGRLLRKLRIENRKRDGILSLKEHRGSRILSPREFVALLELDEM